MAPSASAYDKLDRVEVGRILFHPRFDAAPSQAPAAIDHAITVEEGVRVGARFHMAGADDANILFFHGNGETVGDYDPIGSMYNEQGLSLLAVDYRGYGLSSGTPTASAMMRDAHVVFRQVKDWLQENNRRGPLLLMGRSLGSAPAIELAAVYQDEIAALIIESGFATTLPLLQRLGLDTAALGITEADGFGNVRKIATVNKPTMILHGHLDQIIPVAEAEILQAQSGARSKEFQMVPGADHNSIIAVAGRRYFEAIRFFVDKIGGNLPRWQRKRR